MMLHLKCEYYFFKELTKKVQRIWREQDAFDKNACEINACYSVSQCPYNKNKAYLDSSELDHYGAPRETLINIKPFPTSDLMCLPNREIMKASDKVELQKFPSLSSAGYLSSSLVLLRQSLFFGFALLCTGNRLF